MNTPAATHTQNSPFCPDIVVRAFTQFTLMFHSCCFINQTPCLFSIFGRVKPLKQLLNPGSSQSDCRKSTPHHGDEILLITSEYLSILFSSIIKIFNLIDSWSCFVLFTNQLVVFVSLTQQVRIELFTTWLRLTARSGALLRDSSAADVGGCAVVTSLTYSDESVFCPMVLWRFLSAVCQGLFLCLDILETHTNTHLLPCHGNLLQQLK